jgi:5-methylcytosine-specific restriction protein A
VIAWRPVNGFPVAFPANENLVVYIIKTSDQQYWAGWFKENTIPSYWPVNTSLKRMFEEQAGIIKFNATSRVLINSENVTWPFYFKAVEVINQIVNEDAIEEDLVNEDVSSKLADIATSNLPPEVKQRIINIRKRNKAVVNNLKNLYENKCQISGEDLTFIKRNGERYSEVHHLISLGENGSDSYANAIVVSPLIHRMLHYADVSAIDLNNIGDGQLPITINGVGYTITWHPEHVSTVEDAVTD